MDQRSLWERGDQNFRLASSLDFHIGVSKQGSVLSQSYPASRAAPSAGQKPSEKSMLSEAGLGQFCWACWGSLSSYTFFLRDISRQFQS